MCYYFFNMQSASTNMWEKITSVVRLGMGKGEARERELKRLSENHRKALVKAGKQQFEKLKDMGLSIPVALS